VTGDAPESGTQPRRLIRRAVGLLVLVLFGYVSVTFIQVWRAQRWDGTAAADAAVVLGAAQYDGRPSGVFRARLDHAAELYRDGVVEQVVVTGGGRAGDRFTEAYSGLKYLIGEGVSDQDIVVVDDGSSTWESLAASVRVLRREGIDQVLLVSDPYHSFRLQGIADEVGLDAEVSPVDSADSTFGQLARETVNVAVGRIIGYRRLVNLVE
jgi:uncharacterized SAM-binding protein YcdF (DUF218 family)